MTTVSLFLVTIAAIFVIGVIGEIVFARLITPEAPSTDDLPGQARSAGQRVTAGAAAARGRDGP